MAKKPDVALQIEPGEDGPPIVSFLVAISGGWVVVYRLALRDGEMIVSGLNVVPIRETGWLVSTHPEAPGKGLTAGLLKDEIVLGEHVYSRLPQLLRDIEQVAKQHPGSDIDERLRGPQKKRAFITREAVDTTPETVSDEWNKLSLDMVKRFHDLLAGLGFDAEAKPRVARRGPKPWPDEKYVAICKTYIERCEAGSPHPVVDVAAARSNKSVPTVRAALNRARERGLMARQTQGRAGGVLTERGEEVARQIAGKKKPKKKQARRKGKKRRS